MAEIFLSYRRQDSRSATGRLADRLEQHFGEARVFRDHASIIGGDDFAAAIARAIDASSVVLVVIGPDWLDSALPGGGRRLDDPGDYVRIEIESALAVGVPLLPVLVDGAQMPDAAALPASIARFARSQAIELTDSRWRYDTQRLIDTLRERFAIEALPGARTGHDAGSAASGTGRMQRGGRLGDAAARLAIDLLDLALHPTRLILRRQTGRARDHIRAFVFLVSALVGSHLIAIWNLSLMESALRNRFEEALYRISLALQGAALWLLIITMLLIVMTIAWRIAGTRVQFRQLSIVTAYVAGGAGIGCSIGIFIFMLGIALVDSEVYVSIADAIWPARSSLPAHAPWDERIAVAMQYLQPIVTSPPAQLAFAIASIVWLLTLGWLMVAWQAYSLSFRVSRLRALAATLMWFGLLWLIGLAIAWVVA